MEGQIELLIKIQEVDDTIGEILLHKETYPKMIKELNKTLQTHRDELDAAQKALDENTEETKKMQSQATLAGDRIERVEGKLPLIKTNKEYQALNKEIEAMRKEIIQCEDRAITLMEEVEALKSEVAEKEAVFSKEDEGIKSKITGYEREVSKFDESAAKHESEKTELAAGVDKKNLAIYEKIRSKRDGVAIVAAIKEVCQGCYMNIPPQLFNLVQRSSELNTCPNCNRILYWKAESE